MARSQPRRPWVNAATNDDNDVGVGSWTGIGIDNSDHIEQGAFDAADNHIVATMDGRFLFGATLMYKGTASTPGAHARMVPPQWHDLDPGIVRRDRRRARCPLGRCPRLITMPASMFFSGARPVRCALVKTAVLASATAALA